MSDVPPSPPPQRNPKGLYCPACKGVRLVMIYTRSPCPGVKIRYRKCSACDHRFKTREVIVTMPPPKVKKA